jgi:ABC-type dipeptide/oligopeptide/nickel transport system permease component
MNRKLKLALRTVGVIFTVITGTFVLIRQLPGGPAAYLKSQFAKQGRDPADVSEQVSRYFGSQFDGPLHEQYIDYMISLTQGDLGTSFFFGQPVAELLFQALPWTLFVVSIGTFLSFGIAIMMGSLFAYKNGTLIDKAGSFIAVTITGIPYYIVALLLLLVFAYNLEIFPQSGRYSIGVSPGLNLTFILDVLHHAILPAGSLVLTRWAGASISMRGNAISEMGSDYLRVARLRGLGEKRIISRYVVWNSVLPMYTGLLISIGFMFGGAVILEQIFIYEGVGWYMFQGIVSRDYPLMMGAFLLIVTTVSIAIFVADLTYGYIDPRAGSETSTDGGGPSFVNRLVRFVQLPVRVVRRIRRWKRSREVEGRTGDRGAEASIFVEVADEETAESTRERWNRRFGNVRHTVDVFLEDNRAKFGLLSLTGFVLMGLFGANIVSEPTIGQAKPFLQPLENMTYPLGTNHQGQGLARLVIYSTEPMLQMIVAGTLFAGTLATALATVAGYLGGLADYSISAITDVMIALPGLPLFIVIVAFFEPQNPYLIGIVLSVGAWAGLARQTRSEVLKYRESPYVEASHTMGISNYYIITRDIVPNLLSYLTIRLANMAKGIVFGSVALYYLGVLPYSSYNWGIILNNAQQNGALSNPDLLYWLLIPIVVIGVFSLSLVFFAQGLDRIFNPRIRASEQTIVE